MGSFGLRQGLMSALGLGAALTMGCGGGSSDSKAAAAPTASPTASATPAASTSLGAVAASPDASAGVAATTPTQAPDEDDEVAAELVEYHRHHHHGGVAGFIALAIRSLGVSAEQRATLDGIEASLRAGLEPSRAAEAKLLSVLADGVAAGKVDRTRTDAAVAQLGTTSNATHAAVVDALNKLHAALTQPQRTALVDKVEAHWQVWRQANDDAEVDGGAPHEQDRVEAFARRYSLTADQVEKIRANWRSEKVHEPLDRSKVAAQLKAFGTAFAGPTFDAKALGAGPANAHLASWGATRMARFFEAVTPVLTPEQRTELAERLRARAADQDAKTKAG